MLTKEELLSLDISKLMELAGNYGIVLKDGDQKEGIIYAILDKAAEEEASNTAVVETPKRKRTRIVKKDTVDSFIDIVGKGYMEKTGLKADFYVVDIGEGAHRLS